LEAHLSDLAGYDHTSEAERSICRRAAVLTTELERLEVRFATSERTEPELVDLYARAASSLRRLLEAVGLQRRSRDVTPTLDAYLSTRADHIVAEHADDDPDDDEEAEAGASCPSHPGVGASAAPTMHPAPETNPHAPQRVGGRLRPRLTELNGTVTVKFARP
jgi:hypothetical protein